MNAVDRIRRITTAFPGWQVDFESDQITVSRPGGFSAGIDPELARTLSADEIISNIRDNPEFALGESAPRIEHEDTVVQLRIIIQIFKLTAERRLEYRLPFPATRQPHRDRGAMAHHILRPRQRTQPRGHRRKARRSP